MVFVELEIEALHPARVDACKVAPSRSLAAGIGERYSTPRLTNRRAASSSIAPADTLFAEWRRPFR